MNHGDTGTRRTVVPRWRPLARTPEHELPSLSPTAASRKRDTSRLSIAERRWREDQTVENAVGLLDTAVVFGAVEKAKQAAKWLSRQPDQLTHPIEASLKKLLEPATSATELSGGLGSLVIRRQIAEMKERLVGAPRDAISACELARLYTVNGQNLKAAKWLKRAISLSPNDRYILRSAAQFYAHVGQPEEGLELIWRSDAVKHDPWVQAAEVAVADSADRYPKWALRRSSDLMGSRGGISQSELATGLASFHEKSGAKRRFVKQLLSSGLENPTENALAQAVWIRAERGISVEQERLSITGLPANEAYARQAIEVEQYSAALSYTRNWIDDEPYSVPAYQAAGMCASSFLGDWDIAVSYYSAALRLAPNTPLPLNGLLVATAYLDHLDEAEEMYERLETFKSDPAITPYVHAARGLIAFRRGDIDVGRQAYIEAMMSGASADGDNLKLTALIFWLEQEIRTGAISDAQFAEISRKLELRLLGNKTLAGVRAQRLWRARKALLDKMLFERREPRREAPLAAARRWLQPISDAISLRL